MTTGPASPPSRRHARWAAALPAIAALVAFAFTFQGSRGIWEPDEGRYTNVALEMLRSGDWLHPALNHETPHYTKPPLTYWAIAGAVKLAGRNEWAVRLPNALAFVATVLLVLFLARRLVPARPQLAALVYATSLLPFAAANVVSTDTLLTLMETAALACFVEARWGGGWGGQGGRRWVLGMWLAWGLAFLTKGPPALLPLLAILVFVAIDERGHGLRRIAPPLGIAAFLGIGLSWFVVVVVQRPELLGFFLGTEVVGRVVSSKLDRHAQWYGAIEIYAPVLIAGPLPWIVPLGATFADAVRQLRRRGASWLAGDPQRLFLLVWFVLPLTVFCLARSRLALYLLPLWVPLAMVTARRLAAPGGLLGRRARVWLAVWALSLVGLKGAAALKTHHKDSRALAAAVRAAVSEPFDEVVFVDTWPRYGVSLYLDAEVEAVTVAPWPPDPDALGPRQLLAYELEEDETRVFGVERRDLAYVVPTLRTLGVEPVERGRWHDLVLLAPAAHR